MVVGKIFDGGVEDDGDDDLECKREKWSNAP